MVVLDPERVELAGAPLGGVRTITLDRVASRLVEGWSDGGPFCVFVDAPEVRVTVKVVRVVSAGEVGAPITPGELEVLSFVTAPNASGARGQKATLTVCCASVTHEAPSGEAARGAAPGVMQTITLRAVASGAGTDPVTFVADEGV